MNLKTFLRKSNITKAAFARTLGITPSAVGHWVSGRERVDAERVLEVEAATGGMVSRHEIRPDLYPKADAA